MLPQALGKLGALPRAPGKLGALQRARVALGAGALLLAAAGCGGAQEPVAAAPPPPPPATPSPVVRDAPPGQLARGDVEDVLAQGPAWLLKRVPIEEVIRGGAFIGWKILALPESWSGAELKQGDVVTKVNGTALERPDDLFTAWRNLVSASELRIAYEREGAARELLVPIHGAPSPELLKAFEGKGPPPARRPSATSRRRATTVIEEDDGTPPADGNP